MATRPLAKVKSFLKTFRVILVHPLTWMVLIPVICGVVCLVVLVPCKPFPTPTPTITFTQTPTFSFTPTQESEPTKDINKGILPKAAFNFPGFGVVNKEIAFTNTSTGSNLSYTWDFGDGSPIVTDVNPVYVYAVTGIFTVTLTVTNNVGSDTTRIQVVIEELISDLTATSDEPTTLGDTTTLVAAIKTGSDVSYAWDFGDGKSLETSEPVVTHTYLEAGTFTVTVTATNDVSSQDTTMVVTVVEAIAGLDAVNDSPTPLGGATTLTATIAAGSNVTYTWDFGDGQTGSGDIVRHTYPSAGTYTATVTAANSAGSESASTQVIVEEVIRDLAACNDGPTVLGSTTTLTATIGSGSNVTYTWDFGDGNKLDSSDSTVTHTYPKVGTFTAIVTASNDVSTGITMTIVKIIPSPTPLAVVQGNQTVNLRKGPGTNYEICGLAHPGEQFNIIGRNRAGDWIEVRCTDGKLAWIWCELVEVQGIEPDAILVETDIPPEPTSPAPLTPIPTVSTVPIPGKIYHKAPLDSANCSCDNKVELKWEFTGSLGSDGFYSVRIWFKEKPQTDQLLHVPAEQPFYIFDVGGYAGRSFCWNVQAVRLNPSPPPKWIELSPNTDPWCFSVYEPRRERG